MTGTAELLAGLGLPGTDAHGLPASPGRFPDGAPYRVEIPSVEGPRCLQTVLSEAKRYEVPVAPTPRSAPHWTAAGGSGCGCRPATR